jgi:SAM-dependent methyltransferase
MGLDADLIAYYDAEAASGRRAGHGDVRSELYESFRNQMRAENRLSIVDVGAGPGVDTALWLRDGFDVVGVDLTFANVRVMGDKDLAGVTGSLYQLPFRSGSFDAVWTMNTFVHVPDARLAEAFGELVRVATPGAALGIGSWGGKDYEGVPEFGDLRPYRFFALRSHDRWYECLSRHGRIEEFVTFEPTSADAWEYQFGVLRAPG